MATEIQKESRIDPKYRKIFRAMIEKGNKLDETYKSPDSFAKIFQSETTLEREKLQRYCETLIFREPILCGKKAEEILWRRVFYEIIHIVKSNKKNLKCNAQIETMYRLHLSSAYGFYNHLILRFQSEFSSVIELNGFLDFPFLSYEKQPLTVNTHGESTKILREVLIKILHKFLICLGDLSRYQIEYDPMGSTKLSFKYYQMSLILIHTNGIPLNQLGTLRGSDNYGCDAAFYYMYCLSCTEPFVSARENLRLLFAKNRKRHEEINNKKNVDRDKSIEFSVTEQRAKEIKKFLVLFLRIIDSIMVSSSTILSSQTNNKSVLISNHQLQELCQLCLQEFNACMFYTINRECASSAPNEEKLSYLSDELVFKLTMTILMTIEQLKGRTSSQGGPKTSMYFTAVAFALVFFSHIVNHTIIRLQESLLNLNKKNSPSPIAENSAVVSDSKGDGDEVNNVLSTSTSSCGDDDPNEKPPKKKRNVRLLFGLRRRKHNSDSDTNESESELNDSGGNGRRSFLSDDESADDKPRPKSHRQKNIAKFLDRENLSETEMNIVLSGDDDEDNNAGNKTNRNKRTVPLKSTDRKVSSEDVRDALVEERKDTELKKQPPTETAVLEDKTAAEVFVDDLSEARKASMSTQSSLNFKEFSSQLYSCLSTMQEPFLKSSDENLASGEPHQLHTGEFSDNRVYKLILSGNKNIEMPPGFEINTKEAKEIEELGQKLATFQIETDTEIDQSIFNSSNTSTSSDGDESKLSQTAKIPDLKNVKVLINLLQSEALLPTIKVFCDWLLCNINVIQSISQVSTTVWSKLAVLLNCIPLEKQIASESICESDNVRNLILKSFETKSWNSQPLSEDVHMRSFGALKLEHSLLKFDINKLNQLNVAEENLLRLCQLRRFGYLIASLSQSQLSDGGLGFFEYNVSKATFNAIVLNDSKKDNDLGESANKAENPETNKEEQIKQASKDNRKFQLMKNMAQLRLEAEISQLESNYKMDNLTWSPYLIVDTMALCENLKLVQDLTRTNKFIIIVPLVVIDNLDSIKKDSKLAREAIRWLENQFKQGNRFLRAQTQNEKINSGHDMTLRKRDLELWRFHQLIDCCKYFQEESTIHSNNSHSHENRANIITILTFSELNDEKFKNMVKLSAENSIKLENIKEFCDRWKLAYSK